MLRMAVVLYYPHRNHGGTIGRAEPRGCGESLGMLGHHSLRFGQGAGAATLAEATTYVTVRPFNANFAQAFHQSGRRLLVPFVFG